MTRDSVGVTCDGVAVLGASQPQLSVHDSGNSKLGYTWPGCHQPPGRRCCAIPGHCHRPGCTIATTAALSPEEKSEPSSDVESGHAGDTGDRAHSSSAVLQCCRRGHHPGPGQRAAWEPSLHILTPEAGHEQRTPSCVEISSRGDMEVRTQEWQFCSIHTDR